MKNSSIVQMLALLIGLSIIVSCSGSSGKTGTNGSNSSAASDGATQPAGTPFVSEEGKFKVTLPPGFAPFREKKNEATKMTGYTSSGPNNTACNVSYSELSESLVSQLDTPEKMEKALGAMRDNSVQGMGGISDREEKIRVQDYTGLSVYGTIPNVDATAYFRMDNLIANSRGYRFGCLSTNKEELNKPEIQAFFRSFQISR